MARSQFVWWLDSVVFLIALAAHVHKQQKISKSGQKGWSDVDGALGQEGARNASGRSEYKDALISRLDMWASGDTAPRHAMRQ